MCIRDRLDILILFVDVAVVYLAEFVQSGTGQLEPLAIDSNDHRVFNAVGIAVVFVVSIFDRFFFTALIQVDFCAAFEGFDILKGRRCAYGCNGENRKNE